MEEGKEITLLSTKMLKINRKSFSIKLEICTLACNLEYLYTY